MLKRVVWITVLALAIALAGCGTRGQEAGRSNSTTSADTSAGGAPTVPPSVQQGGAVQTPDDAISNGPANSADTSASDSASALPGQGQGAMAGPSGGGAAGSPGSGAIGKPADWQTYVDQQFGFTINYPPSYAALVNPQGAQNSDPKPVHQVRFQEAPGDVAPAPLEVEVFENSAGTSLEKWLDAHGPKGSRTPTTVGDQSGYQVTLRIEIAPNQFYYVAKGSYVYKLTPLGSNGQEMLKSFTLQ